LSVRYGLLGLLSRGPAHGYALRAEFEAATGATWPLNIGQVYSTLARLERDGLISTKDETDDAEAGLERRRYHLTVSGLEELRRWFATPVPRDAPPRSELVVKVILALMLPEVDARRVLDVQRAASMRSLQVLTQLRGSASSDMATSLAADAAIFGAEAEIRWLEHCEAKLVQSKRGAS